MPMRKAPYREVTLSPRPHSLNTIWISDDLLSNTFNRFFRFSPNHAHNTERNRRLSRIHKRHGSNVPGPLEAQRRLARRRVVGLAQCGAGAGIDISTLFGEAGPATKELEWKAPERGKDKHEKVEDGGATTSWLDQLGSVFRGSPHWPSLKVASTLRHTLKDLNSSTDQPYVIEQLTQAQILEQLRKLTKYAAIHYTDLANFSKEAFVYFLASKPPVENILGFLNDQTLNHPDAHNFTHVLSYFTTPQTLSPQDMDAIIAYMRKAFELGLISTEETPNIIDAICSYTDREGRTDFSTLNKMYTVIWEGLCACRIHTTPLEVVRQLISKLDGHVDNGPLMIKLYRYLYPFAVKSSDDAHWLAECGVQALCSKQSSLKSDTLIKILQVPSTNEQVKKATIALVNDYRQNRFAGTWQQLVVGWLLCLRRADVAVPWHSIYRVLAPTINVLDLTAVFQGMRSRSVCRYLASWFSLLPAYSCRHLVAEYDCNNNMTRLSLAKETARAEKMQESADWKKVQHDFEAITLLRKWSVLGEINHYGDLLIALFRNGMMTMINQELVLTLVMRLFGVKAVIQICDDIRRAGVYLHPPLIAAMMKQLVREEPAAALALYKRRKVYISSVPHLLTSLIACGVPSTEIFTILKAEDPWQTLPLDERHLPENDMTQNRYRLVNAVADAFAKQETVSPRVAFRNVSTCYRYLKSRRAPISPVISRALVRAGITGPLLKGEAVSIEQVKWILGVVAQVEGEDVAAELDELVWRWLVKVWRSIDKNQLGDCGTRDQVAMRDVETSRPPLRRAGVPIKSPKWKSAAYMRERGELPKTVRVGKFMDEHGRILDQRMRLEANSFMAIRRKPVNKARKRVARQQRLFKGPTV